MAIRPERIDATYPGFVYPHAPRNVYWEMTRACDLACRHCRADARCHVLPGELTTGQAVALIDSVKELGSTLCSYQPAGGGAPRRHGLNVLAS